MRRFAALFPLVLTACPLSPYEAGETVFPCRDVDDCAAGFSCDLEWSTCVSARHRDDPLVGDAGEHGQAPLAPGGAPELVLDEVFVREAGAPAWRSWTFSLAGQGAPALVVVQNHGCASADVTLNGAALVVPDDLTPVTQQVEREVTLNADNELRARLRSEPGCALLVVVVARP